MMEGKKVQCPNCKRSDFVTTEKYNPDVTPNGSFVKCTLPYHIDWLTSSTTLCSEMTCPECLAQLAPSGRLTVIQEAMPVTPLEIGIPGEEASSDDRAEEGMPTGPVVSDMPWTSQDPSPVNDNTGSGFECPICHATFETARKLQGHKGGAHRKGKGKKS